MLTHPQFDPVALQLGPLAIRWYGLMYLVAFAQFVWLGRLRLARMQPGQPLAVAGLQGRDVEDLMFYGVLGAVIGYKIGYTCRHNRTLQVGSSSFGKANNCGKL